MNANQISYRIGIFAIETCRSSSMCACFQFSHAEINVNNFQQISCIGYVRRSWVRAPGIGLARMRRKEAVLISECMKYLLGRKRIKRLQNLDMNLSDY